jgi:geranyl-CoA carboxylase beta subunit
MCGRAFEPDFLYTWPNAFTGVMGGEQAAKTMSIVARGKAEASGIQIDETLLAQQEKMLAMKFDDQSDAFYTSGHLMDDGMIDPRQTRNTLGMLLETVFEARRRIIRPNSYGVSRL